MANGDDVVVQDPTYMADIRHFFEAGDIACMSRRDIDLATYRGVKLNAQRIYFHTREGSMPPSPERRWSEARVQTFYNWMRNGCRRGIAEPATDLLAPPSAPRIRKNLADLDAGGEELETLKKAFRGLLGRDRDDPSSYFSLAGLHWLPQPNVYCRHHENAYNPWHRAYLLAFEDALRTVEGCEDVTLPYWDIQADTIPDVLYQEPFAEYEIPIELASLDGRTIYPAGTVTRRNPADEILTLSRRPDIDIGGKIETALASSYWEDFNGWSRGIGNHTGIISAHDNGHGVCGPTLANQDVAAFDPIFWFFHANWDRLWWHWQQLYDATSLQKFKTHLEGDAYWLEDPVVNKLEPFAATSMSMIDLNALGVDYEHPRDQPVPAAAPPLWGSLVAAEGFTLPTTDRVSVRVKGVNRLEIPGSFNIALRVGDRVIQRKTLFQSTTPKQCATCRKNATVNADFIVARAEIGAGRVSASIELFTLAGSIELFPLSQCGSPTMNIRLLLEA